MKCLVDATPLLRDSVQRKSKIRVSNSEHWVLAGLPKKRKGFIRKHADTAWPVQLHAWWVAPMKATVTAPSTRVSRLTKLAQARHEVPWVPRQHAKWQRVQECGFARWCAQNLCAKDGMVKNGVRKQFCVADSGKRLRGTNVWWRTVLSNTVLCPQGSVT